MTAVTATHVDTKRRGVPFSRLVRVELRKLVDTRAGFWLIIGIAIAATLASLGVMIFVPGDDQQYGFYAQAIGVPINILLPIVSILLVTSEWSQRGGLTTFTLSPHRGSVIGAKAVASMLAGVVGISIAFAIGAVTAVIGAAVSGGTVDWSLGGEISFAAQMAYLVAAFVLSQFIGFMLGVLIRSSAAAIVAYFVYGFVLPGIFGALMEFTSWFDDIQPWVDFSSALGPLYEGGLTSDQWAHLGVTGLVWFVIPMIIGIWAILRSEVK